MWSSTKRSSATRLILVALELSRKHSAGFEAILRVGIADGSIAACDVRMTGNAIMGSLNWIPKWYHGDTDMGVRLVDEFPGILARGLGTS